MSYFDSALGAQSREDKHNTHGGREMVTAPMQEAEEERRRRRLMDLLRSRSAAADGVWATHHPGRIRACEYVAYVQDRRGRGGHRKPVNVTPSFDDIGVYVGGIAANDFWEVRDLQETGSCGFQLFMIIRGQKKLVIVLRT